MKYVKIILLLLGVLTGCTNNEYYGENRRDGIDPNTVINAIVATALYNSNSNYSGYNNANMNNFNSFNSFGSFTKDTKSITNKSKNEIKTKDIKNTQDSYVEAFGHNGIRSVGSSSTIINTNSHSVEKSHTKSKSVSSGFRFNPF